MCPSCSTVFEVDDKGEVDAKCPSCKLNFPIQEGVKALERSYTSLVKKGFRAYTTLEFEKSNSYYEEALKQVGVTPYFVRTNGISGSCTVLISPDGERTMGTFLGPAATLTPDEITTEMLSAYHTIYIEGYLLVNEALVRQTMKRVRAMGLQVALDLSNFNIVNAFRGLLEELIPQYVNILFSNESEAEAFTGRPAHEALQELARLVDVAVVTVGKEGALVCGGGETVAVPASGGKPVDTTGAGDHFAAGFLYGRSQNATLEQSARIGSLLAGHVIGVVGAEIPADRWADIRADVRAILAGKSI